MSESVVERLPPYPVGEENGAPPSKKLKLDSASEDYSSECLPLPMPISISTRKSHNSRDSRPSEDETFDPVQAILDAGRKCQEEEEEARQRDDNNEKDTPKNNNEKEGNNTEEDTEDEEDWDGEDEEGNDDSNTASSGTTRKGKVRGGKKKKKTSNMRRNIKDILKHDQLDDLTITARKEEEERRQRMNLKLQQQQQQLKLLQQQQSQLLRESLSVHSRPPPPAYPNFFKGGQGRYPMNHFPSSGFGDNDLLRKLIKKKHITVSVDSDGNPVPKPAVESKSEDDCILLSSDDESPAPTASSSTFNTTEQKSSFTATNIADLALNSLLDQQPKPRKVVTEVTLSSGEEDDYCNVPPSRNVSSLFDNILGGEGKTLGDAMCPHLVEDEDDDDCVILSPEPEEEEETEDKGEFSQDLLYVPDHLGRVLVNFGHPDEDEDIFLPPQIARIIKPHQIGGIRFLYDNVVESIGRYKTTAGFGCILAHAMGLGKTLQTVSFTDVFLRTVGKTVLIIVPINTIQNWLNEFNRYLPSKNKQSAVPEHTSTRKRGSKSAAKKEEEILAQMGQDDSREKSGSGMEDNSISSTLNATFDCTLDLNSPSAANHQQTPIPTATTNNDSSQSLDGPAGESIPSTSTNSTEEEIQYRNFDIFLLNETVKSLEARERIIMTWSTKGGVLLIGYEMYRMLALKKLKKSVKKTMSLLEEEREAEELSLTRIHECLVNPGPDCVICDEGHRIKNSGAGISQALKAILTKRRVVLTGYPLQNNLMEYWCMVDFVRPNYLGNKAEFSNMFERPIQNGQCADSTLEDKRLMRFRSHVLHSLLEGFVQRRSHAVLKDALPPKEEWVFLVRLTPIQLRIYREFIRYLTQDLESDNASANPIKAFSVCCKIWNHPDVLYNVVKKNLDIEMDLDIEEVRNVPQKGRNGSVAAKPRKGTGRPRGRPPLNGAMAAWSRGASGSGGCLGLGTDMGIGGDPMGMMGMGMGLGLDDPPTSRSESTGISLEWAKPLFENYTPEVMENGVKFEILFLLIEETLAAGDKLLVFSQSLLTLDLMEIFLSRKLDWKKYREYVRLDGSTAGIEREKLINEFNKNTSQKLFLISTRAGSLGINLVGANRVCIFDASWNPCHDSQAVCRVYRYGQVKPCFIYRFVSDCTLEKRIYDRQVNKKGMADRIVDEMNPNAPFKSKDVSSFLVLQHDLLDKLPYIKVDLDLNKFEDPVLKRVLFKVGNNITQEPFEHESLLIDQKHQKLSKSEKRLALKNYQKDKQANATASYQRPSYAQYYTPTGVGGVGSPGSVSSYVSSYNSTQHLSGMNRFGGGEYGTVSGTGSGSGYSSSVASMTGRGGVNAGAGLPQYPGTTGYSNSSSSHSHSTKTSTGQGQGSHLDNFTGRGKGRDRERIRDPFGGATGDRFELHINALKSRGITVYPVTMKQDTFLNDTSGSRNMAIKAGDLIYILASQKGTYLRVQGNLLRVPFVGTDLTQDQAERFVMSLLESTNTGAGGGVSVDAGYPVPVEQQLPPSNSMLYQKNPNHLQITNSRNNSGGDVVMSSPSSSSSSSWHHKSNGHGQQRDREHKSISNSPSRSTPLSSSSSSAFLNSDQATVTQPLSHSSSTSSHSDLQSLSRLAEIVSQRSSPYPNHVGGMEGLGPTPPSDLEVIKLQRSASASGSSSNSNSSSSRTNSPYANARQQSWNSPNPNDPNWPSAANGNAGSGGTKDSSFYTDFTITPITSAGGQGVSTTGGDAPIPTGSSSSRRRSRHRQHQNPSPHHNYSSSTPDKTWLGANALKDLLPGAGAFPGQDLAWPGLFGNTSFAAAAAALRTMQNFPGLDLSSVNPLMNTLGLGLNGSSPPSISSDTSNFGGIDFTSEDQSNF